MRVRFYDKNSRKLFFLCLRDIFDNKWKNVYVKYNVPRKTFDKYLSGEICLPEVLFQELLKSLDEDKQNKIKNRIILLQENWGDVLGGKRAYKLNYAYFKRGREIGLNRIKEKRNMKQTAKIDFVLSKEICEFIGAFIGDGCFNVYKNKLYHIEIAGDRRYDYKYHSERLIPIIKAIISDLNPHIYFPKNKNSIRTVFYSKRLFTFLKDEFGFVPGKKTYTISIPKRIMDSNDEFIRSTIRGIFDTDGGIFLDKRKKYKTLYPRITLDTKSLELYNQLVEYLSKDFKLYNKFNKSRNIYKIEIYGIIQLKKWMSKIGFSNERHLKKVELVPNIRLENSHAAVA